MSTEKMQSGEGVFSRAVGDGSVVRRVQMAAVDKVRFERSDRVRVEIRGVSEESIRKVEVSFDSGTLTLSQTQEDAAELPPGAMIDRAGAMTIGPSGITIDGVSIANVRHAGMVVQGDVVIHGDQISDFRSSNVRIITTGPVERHGTIAGFVPRAQVCVVIYQPECPEIDLSGASSASLHGIDQDELEIQLSGASRVEANGSVRKLYVDTSGAAVAALGGLSARDAKVRATGSSQVTVSAKDEVRGKVSGVSRLTLQTEPTRRDVSASGLATVAEERLG